MSMVGWGRQNWRIERLLSQSSMPAHEQHIAGIVKKTHKLVQYAF